MRAGLPLRPPRAAMPRPAAPCQASVAAKTVMTPVTALSCERPSAATSAMSKATMTGEPVATVTAMRERMSAESVMSTPREAVSREAGVSKAAVPAHRVSSEAPPSSAAAKTTVPRKAVVPTAASTVAGPGMSAPTATGSAACPALTAATSVLIPAMTSVAGEFKVLSAAEAFASESLPAPAGLRTASLAIESRLTKSTFEPTFAALPPGKLWSVGRPAAAFESRTARPVGPSRSASVCCFKSATFWSKSLGAASFRSAGFWSATFGTMSLRSAASGAFPGRFAIRSAIVAHHHPWAFAPELGAPHLAPIIPVAPAVGSLRALVGREPIRGPHVPLPELASIETTLVRITAFRIAAFKVTTVAHALVVAAVVALVVARLLVGHRSRVACAVEAAFIGPTLVAPAVVRSHRAHGVDSPLPLSDELQRRRCRNSSKKHQRVIAHRTSSSPSNAGRFSESTRSPTFASVPHPRPSGRFPSAVSG